MSFEFIYLIDAVYAACTRRPAPSHIGAQTASIAGSLHPTRTSSAVPWVSGSPASAYRRRIFQVPTQCAATFHSITIMSTPFPCFTRLHVYNPLLSPT